MSKLYIAKCPIFFQNENVYFFSDDKNDTDACKKFKHV